MQDQKPGEWVAHALAFPRPWGHTSAAGKSPVLPQSPGTQPAQRRGGAWQCNPRGKAWPALRLTCVGGSCTLQQVDEAGKSLKRSGRCEGRRVGTGRCKGAASVLRHQLSPHICSSSFPWRAASVWVGGLPGLAGALSAQVVTLRQTKRLPTPSSAPSQHPGIQKLLDFSPGMGKQSCTVLSYTREGGVSKGLLTGRTV